MPEGSSDKDIIAELELETSSELAGEYTGQFGLIEIAPDNERFAANAMGAKLSLRPEDDHWFSPRIMLWFIPLQPEDMKAVKVTRASIDGIDRLIGQDNGKPFLLGDLITPYPASEVWDKYIGVYEIGNDSEVDSMQLEEIQFKRGEDYYFIEATSVNGQYQKVPVKPLNDRQFVILGTGRGFGDTVTQIGTDNAPVFSGSGQEYRRME